MNIGWITGVAKQIVGSFLGLWFVLCVLAGSVAAVFTIPSALHFVQTSGWITGAGNELVKQGIAAVPEGSRAVKANTGTSNKVSQFPPLVITPPQTSTSPVPPTANLSNLTPQQKAQIRKMSPAEKQKLLRELSKP